jgi:RNAse (barnase) inhibitor barstar
VALFDTSSDPDSDVGFRLLLNGPVRLYWRPETLEADLRWLSAHAYRIARIDASACITSRELLVAIGTPLDFPDYYGRSLDALNDCLRDVVDHDRAGSGLAVVFTGYDSFAARDARTAQVVLEILADQSRYASLLGNRLLCLVQSNDPQIRFEPVGATSVNWNDAERLDSRRRPS